MQCSVPLTVNTRPHILLNSLLTLDITFCFIYYWCQTPHTPPFTHMWGTTFCCLHYGCLTPHSALLSFNVRPCVLLCSRLPFEPHSALITQQQTQHSALPLMPDSIFCSLQSYAKCNILYHFQLRLHLTFCFDIEKEDHTMITLISLTWIPTVIILPHLF